MNDKLQSLAPKFVGKTELRVDVRVIGKGRKIIVTVIDYSPINVNVTASDNRATKAAIDAARKHPIISADYTRLPLGMIFEDATDPATGKRTKIRVRSNSFIFAAAE